MINRQVIDYMGTRQSPFFTELAEPGPDQSQLEALLKLALHVPDHSCLEPWRLVVLQGEGKQQFLEAMLAFVEEEGDQLDEKTLYKLKKVFMPALQKIPALVFVVSSIKASDFVPKQEQLLSSGALCMNILWAVHAYGYDANWVTGWWAASKFVHQRLQLLTEETIAGAIFIGSCHSNKANRKRPIFDKTVSFWQA